MLFGLDGVEIGLIIVFFCLFGGILSGFPVAFAIGGAGVISFGIIAALDSAGPEGFPLTKIVTFSLPRKLTFPSSSTV